MSGFDDFPELIEADRQSEQAALLLEAAAVEIRRAGESRHGWSQRGELLRGAAALAQTAVIQLAITSGWNSAAAAASRAGLLDGDE